MSNSIDLAKCGHCNLAIAFQTTASVLNQSLLLSEVLERILESVGQVVPNDAANIMLIENDVATIVACHGYEKIDGAMLVMGQSRKITEMPNLVRMALTHQPIVVPNTNASPDWISLKTSTWIHSYTSAPILHRGRLLGYINLNSGKAGFYTAVHASRLLSFADQAAVAIQNAHLYEEAQREIAERKLAEDELQKAKAELEVRVEQRTLELLRANEQLLQELDRRQKAEAALERERMSLEQKVQERTSELSSANAELAKAAQMKDTFLASMSHELRTPLNAVLNISETLQEQVFGDLNPKQMHLARTIEESGRHLLALINDILDISKIGAGKLELVWDLVSVKMLCDKTLKLIDEAARKKNLLVCTSIDPVVKYIRGDQRRLSQILLNLLNNAIKFTPPGGSIGLLVCGDEEKQKVKFTIYDSGIGISEDDIKLLFRPFTQLDNGLSRQFEGTGLGLALVYQLVEMHGGSIEVESQADIGSKFTINLCWKKDFDFPGSGDNPNFKKEPLNNEERRMDPIARLSWYLNELEIDVVNFWVGEPNRKISSKTAPGVIVIDADSTGDPKETLQDLRKIDNFGTLPTLVLSTQDHLINQIEPTDRLFALSYPVSRQELRSAIKRIAPSGTASLINLAVIVRKRELEHPELQAKILIVDDNETSTRILGEYLGMNGMKIFYAFNGYDAVARAREAKPDLILMDIQMPKMDGFEAIRSIRMCSEIQKVPIVALTALAMSGDRARCIEAGADEYISKPIALRALLGVIDGYLSKTR